MNLRKIETKKFWHAKANDARILSPDMKVCVMSEEVSAHWVQ